MKIICKVCQSSISGDSLIASDYRVISSEMFKYLKCNICESLILDEVKVNKDFYEKYYGNKYYGSLVGLKKKFEQIYSKFINNKKFNVIKSIFNNTNNFSLLDIGAGDLGFLNSITDVNIKKSAIDIYKGNGPKDSNIKLINDDFVSHDFGHKKFDVITSWHVIEHITDPAKFLQKIYSLIKNKGVAVISTPNVNSFGYKWFNKNWYHLDAPRHTVLFTEKSLISVASKAGFKGIQTINMFYEFPFDLWHSAKKSGFLVKALVFLLYPILKVFDRETVTLILKK